MGNRIWTEEERKAQSELVIRLMDMEYNDYQNNIIRWNKPLMYEIVETIPKNPQKAEEMIRKFYKEKHMRWEDRDNWFCYSLADKLVMEAGIEPQIMYEE